MDDRQIFRKLLQYCRGLRLNSVGHLVGHLALHLVLHLERLLLQNRHRRRLDVVRQSHLDDLRLDVVHQNRRDDLHLDEVRQNHRDDRRLDEVRLDVVRQNHRDDLRLDDLVRLDERQLDEVLHLRRRLDVVRHFPK